MVHTSPSLQLALFSLWVHPSIGSQPSSVQALASLQLVAPEPMQVPSEQVSVVVHAFESLQAAPFAV
jgi:hypothetical protein